MIYWKDACIKIRTNVLLDQVNLTLQKGQPLGIIGPNGTGKTVLAKAIAGLMPVFGNVEPSPNTLKTAYVSFQSSLRLKNGGATYRQQRWNNLDAEMVPVVKDELQYSQNKESLDPLIKKFNFEELLDSFVISLSNGEQRKMELIRALSSHPDLVIIDNAFNGLDSGSRVILSNLLEELIHDKQTIVMTGLIKEDFPESFQHFIQLSKDEKPQMKLRSEIQENYRNESFAFKDVPVWKNSGFTEIIGMENVCLNYGDKSILKDINWQVNASEHWVLSGQNGSGKTSLLNMIFADNPKAYGCNIRLFGKQKGSGETIWDIKNKIGFISPELHQYLPSGQLVIQVICSGLFDSEGLYIKPTTYQEGLAKQWLKLIGYSSLANKEFSTLSASEQRIVLLIRTLIKNPPLLLLDEPFQGLDPVNISKIQNLIDNVAGQTNCAMIFVSHFKHEIPASFDRELQLSDGEVVFSGKRNLKPDL